MQGEHSREVLYLKNADVQNGSLSCLPVCRPRPLAVVIPQKGFSIHGWIIGTMCAVVLLTLVVLMACFVRRNRGGKYAGTPPPKQQDMFPMEKGQFVFNQGWVLLLFHFRTETLCFWNVHRVEETSLTFAQIFQKKKNVIFDISTSWRDENVQQDSALTCTLFGNALWECMLTLPRLINPKLTIRLWCMQKKKETTDDFKSRWAGGNQLPFFRVPSSLLASVHLPWPFFSAFV